MLVLRHPDEVTRDPRTVLTMGTFDGVHLGHQCILTRLVHAARADAAPSMLLTFDPHPREVIGRGSDEVRLLTTIDERLRLLERYDIDMCFVLPFTRDLSLLTAEEFFRRIIVDRIGARHLIVGFDHAFGRGRSGTIEALRALGAAHGIAVDVVPELDVDGQKASSSAIRSALMEGDIARATRYLGRPYQLSGIIQRGEGLGAQIGFPTANIHIDHPRKLLPKVGVYAARVGVGTRTIDAMMNIGYRPTVSNEHRITVEAHLFDFTENIYGVPVDVAVLERVRDERAFPSIDALAEQLRSDRDTVRAILDSKTLHSTTR